MHFADKHSQYSDCNFVHSYRLKQELENLISDKCRKYHASLSALEFKFHTPPGKPNCTAWLGGTANIVNDDVGKIKLCCFAGISENCGSTLYGDDQTNPTVVQMMLEILKTC